MGPALTESLQAPIETEVLAHGLLPLAISARCFTARHHGLQKDQCAFKCMEDPQGLKLRTQEAQDFLVINGVQTLSSKPQNLLGHVDNLRAAGVQVLRLLPQAQGMGDTVARARAALDAAVQVTPAEACDGFWYDQPGITRHTEATLS